MTKRPPARRGSCEAQRAVIIGHHSAAFTLEVYAHLLDGEEAAAALDLAAVLPRPAGSESGEKEEEWPGQPIGLLPVAERDRLLRSTTSTP